MGRAGYNTHGRKRITQKEMCKLNGYIIGADTDKDIAGKNKKKEGLATVAKKVYLKYGITGLNIYASNLNKKFPNGNYTEEIILSWVKDIIKPEDIKKLKIYNRTNKTDEVSTDDAR